MARSLFRKGGREVMLVEGPEMAVKKVLLPANQEPAAGGAKKCNSFQLPGCRMGAALGR